MCDKWDRRFLERAELVAECSKDPSTKVGAVVVRPNLTTAGDGYNGFPRGMVDHPELYADREVKYSRIIHAELNAILNAYGSVEGCTIYCTHFPCTACALVIIQTGIERVVTKKPTEDMLSRWGEQFEKTRAFFAEAEIEVVEIDG
jgi:dCMP deaminase